MSFTRTQRRIFRAIALVWLCGFAVVITDIFILDKNKNFVSEIKEISKSITFDKDVKISGLRAQHERYLKEGVVPINTQPPSQEFGLTASSAENDDTLEIKEKSNEQSSPISVKRNLTIEDILAEAKQAEMAQMVEPASGFDGDIFSETENDISEGTQDEIQESIDSLHQLNKFSKEESLVENEEQADDDIVSINTRNPEIIDDKTITHNETIEEKKTVVAYHKPTATGQVVIIIDDMGVTLRSKIVEVMDAPLTLAYLPYASDLQQRTQRAKANGHEIMLHMPMEAMSKSKDGGPRVLSSSLNDKDFADTLEWGLSQFDGYVGVNNHMGSRLTQDRDSMDKIMKTLKKRGLYFIDSKTIGNSVAAEMAKQNGIPYAERDVFLDHEITPEFVRNALKQLEQVAYRKGYAIAIGHPHKETIDALKEWLPTLKDKGLTLVPASAVLNMPEKASQEQKDDLAGKALEFTTY